MTTLSMLLCPDGYDKICCVGKTKVHGVRPTGCDNSTRDRRLSGQRKNAILSKRSPVLPRSGGIEEERAHVALGGVGVLLLLLLLLDSLAVRVGAEEERAHVALGGVAH